MNSKQKGKRGELELAAVLREAGFEARRGQQYCGANGDADVVHSIPGVHLECKRVEKLNLRSAYEQAAKDAGDDMPIVAHRTNRQSWLVTLSLADLLALIRVGDGLN
jgi:Holliday junction resolvase